jgi:hypothetical protein
MQKLWGNVVRILRLRATQGSRRDVSLQKEHVALHLVDVVLPGILLLD